MRNYWVLTKVLLKNLNFPLSKDILKDKKQLRKAILPLVLILAFMPMMFGIGAIVRIAYQGLHPIGQEGLILGSGFSVVSTAVFFFSIFYVMGVFYYSKDIENLLPLPLKPSEILAAKFTVTLLYEYATEAVFLLPILISFGISSSAGMLYYLAGGAVFLLLPVTPLIYGSILNMIVMRFTNIGRNRDRFRIVGGIGAMFLALGTNFYIQRFSNAAMTPDKLQAMLLSGDNSMVSLMSGIFFSNRFAVQALLAGSTASGLVYLLIYAVITVLLVLLFMLMGEALYFKGVIGISQASSGKKKPVQRLYEAAAVRKPALFSYVLKELRLLFRTPVYFLNCIVMNFLWPAFLLVPFLAQPELQDTLTGLGKMAQSESGGALVLAVAFAVSLFVSSTNGITASAISREGSNLYVCKYLPMSYGRQLMAKTISGILMSLVGTLMLLISAVWITDLPPALLVMILLASLTGIIFSSLTGILLDLRFPKLIWDSEQKAVKQNLNVVLNMLVSIGSAAASVSGILYFRLPLSAAFAVVTGAYLLMDLFLYYLLMKKGTRLLSRLQG